MHQSAAAPVPIRILLDTDIGPDCDDVGALALLHRLADRGEAEILGVLHCTSNPYGAPCIEALNRWFGRPDLPIGTLTMPGFLDSAEARRYNQPVAERFAKRFLHEAAPDATAVAIDLLRTQPDASVDFVSIGPLTNLAALLANPEASSLIRSKVRRLVAMAGRFLPNQEGRMVPEFNIDKDRPAAARILREWPTPIIFCGFETGDTVITGQNLPSGPAALNHPVALAYDLYTGGKGRCSWDPLTVYVAVRGTEPLWRLSEPGRVLLTADGITEFAAESGGPHRMLISQAEPAAVSAVLNPLIEGDLTCGDGA